MKKDKKQKSKKIYNTKIFKWILFGGIAIIVLLIIVYAVLISQDIWKDTAEAWIALIIGGLGAIATAELGYVAIWQNNKAFEISNKMLELDEKEKHSLLFLRNHFIYKREKMNNANFIDDSKLVPVNYFIATFNEILYEKYKETIIIKCVVENLDLEELSIINLAFVSQKDRINFCIVKDIKTSIVYDIDKREYVVQIEFITNRKIFDLIKSNNYFFEITFEYKNIYGIIDKRVCEINFFNCFENKGIRTLTSTETEEKIESLAYRRDI